MIDQNEVIRHSRSNVSHLPVTTARYLVEVVMNEENPDVDVDHKEAFANELQRALDDGYFADLRYDCFLFDVTDREVLDVAPPNCTEETSERTRTLWISILGFTSGHIGWVLNNGEAPYNEDCVPNGESGVVSRLKKAGCKELKQKAREAKTIKVLSYNNDCHRDITHQQLTEALGPHSFLRGEDLLADLMPPEGD